MAQYNIYNSWNAISKFGGPNIIRVAIARTLVLLSAITIASGCDDPQGGVITGNGFVSESILLTADVPLSDTSQEVTIIGLKGSLDRLTNELSAKNETTGDVFHALSVTDEGSFVLAVQAQHNDTITLQYESEEELSELSIVLENTLGDVATPTVRIGAGNGNTFLAPSLDPGFAHVNLASLDIDPSVSYLVFNEDNGASALVSPLVVVRLRISAQPNDTICVVAVAPGDLTSTTLCEQVQ